MIVQQIDHSELTDEIQFDVDTNSMSIHFLDTNTTWVYYNIPDYVYAELMMADSIGEYFNYHIRNKYECKRILPP